MKKTLYLSCTIVLLVIASNLFGQTIQQVKTQPSLASQNNTDFQNRAYTKNLSKYIDRASSMTLYEFTAGGYLTGNNSSYDVFGMHFEIEGVPGGVNSIFFPDTIILESVYFYAAHKSKMSSTADFLDVTVHPYFYSDINSNGQTYGSLGNFGSQVTPIIKVFTVDDVDTSASSGMTLIDFTTWDEDDRWLQSEFIITIDYLDCNDTLAIYTSDPVSGDGQNENRLFAGVYNPTFNDMDWWAFDSYFSGGFNADAMMGAIVKVGNNVAVTVENSEKELDFNTKVFTHPNENSLIIVSYASSQVNYNLQLFDIRGREIYNENVQENGVLNHTINTSNLQLGQYIFSIRTNNGASYSTSIFIK